jgi:hypothetical protein
MLHFEAEEDAFLGLNREEQSIGAPIQEGFRGEGLMGYGSKLNSNLGDPGGQSLSRAQIKWNVLPAPVIHKELDGGKSFSKGIGGYARLGPIGKDALALDPACSILSSDCELIDLIRGNGSDGMKHIHFLVADFIIIERDGRLHGDQTQDL